MILALPRKNKHGGDRSTMRLEILLVLWLVTTICDADIAENGGPENGQEQEVDNQNENEEAAAPPDTETEELLSQPIRHEEPSRERQFEDELPRPHHARLLQPIGLPGELDNMKRGEDPEIHEPLDPFMPGDVCIGWVQKFYEDFLVLGDDKNADYIGFERIFVAMDKNDKGDGEGVNISYAEFAPEWKKFSGFGEADTEQLFYRYFAVIGNGQDADHINQEDVKTLWEMLFMGDLAEGGMPLEDFSLVWKEIILPTLPYHGCPVPEGEEQLANAGRRHRVHPDVYGYFKRKRK